MAASHEADSPTLSRGTQIPSSSVTAGAVPASVTPRGRPRRPSTVVSTTAARMPIDDPPIALTSFISRTRAPVITDIAE